MTDGFIASAISSSWSVASIFIIGSIASNLQQSHFESQFDPFELTPIYIMALTRTDVTVLGWTIGQVVYDPRCQKVLKKFTTFLTTWWFFTNDFVSELFKLRP